MELTKREAALAKQLHAGFKKLLVKDIKDNQKKFWKNLTAGFLATILAMAVIGNNLPDKTKSKTKSNGKNRKRPLRRF